MKEKNVKETCCLLVCKGSSCKDKGGKKIRKKLESALEAKKLHKDIAVHTTECLDECSNGPNVMLYPSGVWFRKVSKSDIEDIVSAAEDALKSQQ